MKKQILKTNKSYGKPERRDQYTVVLEDLRSQFKVFGEGLMGVDSKVETGFKAVDEKFKGVDEKFKGVDEKFKGVDEKFRLVNEKLDSHTEMIAQLMVDVAEIKNDLKQKVGREEFARLEKRVLLLEHRGR